MVLAGSAQTVSIASLAAVWCEILKRNENSIYEIVRQCFIMSEKDLLVTEIEYTKNFIKEAREKFPKTPNEVELSSHTHHDLEYIRSQLKKYNDDEKDEFTKIAVIMEDIYYGILANSGVYTRVLDHGPAGGGKNSRSYFYPDGEWRVDVYNNSGVLCFTYIGHFQEDFSEDGNGPSIFECSIMSGPSFPRKLKIFNFFHGLFFFLIDIVLSNGEWKGGDE